MLLESATTTFNTIDEEHFDPAVIYTNAEASGSHQSSACQKSLKSANFQSKKACGANLPQQIHLKRKAYRTHYQRGSNYYLDGKHLGNHASEAKTKIQPVHLPNRSSIGQIAPPQINHIFESTIAVQHLQLKSRQSTQPCFTSLAPLPKLHP